MLTFSGPGLPAHALPQGQMSSPKHKEALRQVLRRRPRQQPRGTFGTNPTFSLPLPFSPRLPRSQTSHARTYASYRKASPTPSSSSLTTTQIGLIISKRTRRTWHSSSMSARWLPTCRLWILHQESFLKDKETASSWNLPSHAACVEPRFLLFRGFVSIALLEDPR